MIAPVRSEVNVFEVVRSLFFSKGYMEKLEKELVRYFGVKQALLTHSGRTGLYFLLKALPQKRVYLPAYNCWAVTEAAMYANKEIEYVDINLDDYSMDIEKLSKVLVRDSIIIATHQFGIPCDIDAITELARERECFVIEDSAAALGSEISGKKTGSFGQAGIVSFDYSKTLVTGKGGAILFNDEDLYRKVKSVYEKKIRPAGILTSLKYMFVALAHSYATHKMIYPFIYRLFKRVRGSSGSRPAYDLTGRNESYRVGFDDRRARLAYLGLMRLGKTITRRKKIVDFYRNEIGASKRFIFPVIPPHVKAAMVKLPIRLVGTDRNGFYADCIRKGLDIEFLFPFHCGTQNTCPNAYAASCNTMALPIYSALSSRDLHEIKSIIVA